MTLLSAQSGWAAVTCNQVHTEKDGVLNDPIFIANPEFTAANVLGAKKISAKNLTAAAKTALEEAGVQFTVKKYIIGSDLLVISPVGNHLLNKIAKRVFEIDGTRLVYDARTVMNGTLGAYDSAEKRIYLSHNVALTGKLDTTFFHEVKHWSIRRKTMTGAEQIFDAYYRRFPWDLFTRISFDSPYNRVLSFQEHKTHMYHTDLFVKSMLADEKTKTSNNLFLFGDLRMDISATMDVATDIRAVALDLKRRIENGKATVTQKGDNEIQILRIRTLFDVFEIDLPKEFNRDFSSKEERNKFAAERLAEIIALVDRDLEKLDLALGHANRLYHGESKSNVETLTTIDDLIIP